MNGWYLATGFGIFYLVLLFTLGWYTWSKGHKGWFFAGIVFPPLWLVGALLKAKDDSPYARRESKHWTEQGG